MLSELIWEKDRERKCCIRRICEISNLPKIEMKTEITKGHLERQRRDSRLHSSRFFLSIIINSRVSKARRTARARWQKILYGCFAV